MLTFIFIYLGISILSGRKNLIYGGFNQFLKQLPLVTCKAIGDEKVTNKDGKYIFACLVSRYLCCYCSFLLGGYFVMRSSQTQKPCCCLLQ